MRALDALNLAQSLSDNVISVTFISMAFDEGTERVHNAVGAIPWGGFVWVGAGVGTVGVIEEGKGLSPFSLSFGIDGIDDTFIARAVSSDVYGAEIFIYWGFMADNALVADPDEIWSGFADQMPTERGGENAIGLICESEMKGFKQIHGALFNDDHQQLEFSGDLAFEYMPQLAEAQIVWGGKGRTVFGGPERLPDVDIPTLFP